MTAMEIDRVRAEAAGGREIRNLDVVDVQLARGAGINALRRGGVVVGVESEVGEVDVGDAFERDHRV